MPLLNMNRQPLIKQNNNTLSLRIKVIPRHNNNSIAGIKHDELIVRIKAAPEKGKANAELIAYFSKLLGIKKAGVIIAAGKNSRHKSITLPSSCYDKLIRLIET